MLFQRCDKLSRRAVIDALARHPLALAVLPNVPGDIAHTVILVKEQFQISDEVSRGIPGIGRGEAVEPIVAVVLDGIIPSHGSLGAGHPATVFGHLYDSAALHYEEYRKRVEFLYDFMEKQGVPIDKQNRNPSRLSRMPGLTRNGNRQYLAATDIGRKS